MRAINAETGLYTLIGSPIRHSLSPDIYNFGFNYYGLNDVYVCSEFLDLSEGLNAIRVLNIKGFNVTMPYKGAIVEKLNKLSNLSSLCGSVNTVKCVNGEMTGDMTDGQGFILSLQSRGVNIKGANVEIVGSGGAGRAISVAALVNGAAKVTLVNRLSPNFKKAQELSKSLHEYGGLNKLTLKLISSIDTYKPNIDTDILVNATSIGMDNNHSIINDKDSIKNSMTVFDLVYANGGRTQLLKQAKDMGATIIDGKTQLLFQASVAFKLYTGREYPIKEYVGSLRRIVYLVGFMAAGKTTVGEALAKRLRLPFIDLDRYIENTYHSTIANIFRLKGEEGFRKNEHEALEKVANTYKNERIVVATGGGCVLQRDNLELMRSTGQIVYINVSFGEIVNRLNKNPISRPLANNKTIDELGFLYRSRSETYEKNADIEIVGDNRTPHSIVNEIYGGILD